MRALHKISTTVAIIGFLAYLPPSHADYTTETEFAANGSVAQILEGALNQYLMPFEVQQIGNAVYNVGQNYGALGQELTSSTPQMDFVSKHITGYCSPNISLEKQFFQCTSKASEIGNDTVSAQFLEMGDIRASVLLEPSLYTPILALTAQNFIRNITMPFPSLTFANYISNPTTFAKNTSQRTGFANHLAGNALLSVARYALDEMYGMRIPGSTIGGTASSGAAAGQSIMQVMENEATRRFTDPNYVAFLTNTSTDQTALLREIAAMHAFGLWMDYQNYKQNERIAALLSATLANTAGSFITGRAAAATAQ